MNPHRRYKRKSNSFDTGSRSLSEHLPNGESNDESSAEKVRLGSRYLPVFLRRKLLARQVDKQEKVADGGTSTAENWKETMEGVCSFVDISGFSKLASSLYEAEGKGAEGEGAEMLATFISNFFGQLVDNILHAGGDIVKFAGDALICVWHMAPEGNGSDLSPFVQAASWCGLILSSKIKQILPGGKQEALQIHCGVGTGDIQLLCIGNEARREIMLIGEAVSVAARGINFAKAGETVLSKKLCKMMEAQLGTVFKYGNIDGTDEFILLIKVEAPKQLPKIVIPVLPGGMLPAILPHCPGRTAAAISMRGADAAALRLCTITFMLLDGFEECEFKDMTGLLQQLIDCVHANGASLKEMVLDDKGAVAERGAETQDSPRSALDRGPQECLQCA